MKKTILIAAAAAFITSPVFAGDWGAAPAPVATGFNYDYIDADWIYQGFDDELDNGNGFSVAGSKTLGQSFLLNASYSQLDTDIDGADVDIDRVTVGGGYRIHASDRLDIIPQAAAVYTDAGVDGSTDPLDEWGYSVGVGFRFQAMDNLELFANVNWLDSLNDGQVESTVGAILQLTDSLGLRVGGRFVDDSSQLFVGGRVNF